MAWTPAYLPNGQLDQNDPGNIAEYYRAMPQQTGTWMDYHPDPQSIPGYDPSLIYNRAGVPIYSTGPMGGNAAYGGGGPGVGYSAVGAPNSGGGAGAVGSGYGYSQGGAPVASIGTFGQRGAGIYADASRYLGGDFAGAGSGDFAFGGGATENIQGSPLTDLSQNPLSPMDPNATPYDGWQPKYTWDGQLDQNDPGNIREYYRAMGIGSDAGATGGRYELAQQIYSGGGIGSDAARAPNDYGSSSYPYPGGARPTPMQPQPPYQGPSGWPYGPAGGGWGFGRTGSVSDPGGNVDLGYGQYRPGPGGGNFDPQNPGGSGLGYGYGNFPGSLGNDLMPDGTLPPGWGGYDPSTGSVQWTAPGGA